MAPLRTVALASTAACLLACKADHETYVGNWHGEAGDLLINPSNVIILHKQEEVGSWSRTSWIGSWDGPRPVLHGGIPVLFTWREPVEIDKPPYRDGDAWRLEWQGMVMTRLPDHAPFMTNFYDGFDVEPPGWGTGAITSDSSVPEDHRDLIGQWRGLTIDIVIAQDGQVRAESRATVKGKRVDGVVTTWTESELVVQEHDGDIQTFAVQQAPQQVDGRWKMTIDGDQVIKVYDGTPVGVHGDWRKDLRTLYHEALDRQCLKGFVNACVMLSRELDTRRKKEVHPLLEGPAEVGSEIHCCDFCDYSPFPYRCNGCRALSMHGVCENAVVDHSFEIVDPCPAGMVLLEPGPDDGLEPFCLAEREVTVVEFRRCVESWCDWPDEEFLATEPRSTWMMDDPEMPINFVTEAQAKVYCLDQMDGRLPTAEEWLWAAGSGKGSAFPWGNELRYDERLYCGMWDETERGIQPAIACHGGEFPRDRTEQGVYDMMGSVGEYVREAGEIVGMTSPAPMAIPIAEWGADPRIGAPKEAPAQTRTPAYSAAFGLRCAADARVGKPSKSQSPQQGDRAAPEQEGAR